MTQVTRKTNWFMVQLLATKKLALHALDVRFLTLLIPAMWFLLYNPDDRPIVETFIFSMAITTVCVAFAHIIRKFAMPYIELEKLITEVVRENNMAAAVVVFSQVLFYIAIFLGTVLFIKG